MKLGNWVAISKELVSALPTDRAFSKVEAMFSLQVNYDNDSPVTASGLASRWGWSRKRVATFMRKIGTEILYPHDTINIRNQRGHIVIHNRNNIGAKKGHIRFIDTKQLSQQRNNKGTKEEHVQNKKGSTINEPNPKPNNRGLNKRFSPPSLEEVISYFLEKNSTDLEAEKFFDHFTSNGWRVSGKAPMKNWQSAANNWMKRINPTGDKEWY